MGLFAGRHYRWMADQLQQLVLSEDELSECELEGNERLRDSIAEQLASAFKKDNPLFDRQRFLNAAKPGANVNAVTHFFPSSGSKTPKAKRQRRLPQRIASVVRLDVVRAA